MPCLKMTIGPFILRFLYSIDLTRFHFFDRLGFFYIEIRSTQRLIRNMLISIILICLKGFKPAIYVFLAYLVFDWLIFIVLTFVGLSLDWLLLFLCWPIFGLSLDWLIFIVCWPFCGLSLDWLIIIMLTLLASVLID